MQWSPRADLFDGMMDVVEAGGSKVGLVLSSSKVYNGKVAEIKSVRSYRTAKIELFVERSFFLDVDGETVLFDADRYKSIIVEIVPACLPLVI
jgi:diacylglycerol kinase family enzyme